MTFQNAYGFQKAIFQNGSNWQYSPKTLTDLVEFAHLWLRNIKFQQEI